MQAEMTTLFDFPEVNKLDPIIGWSQEIIELEAYFSDIEIPDYPIRLNQCSIILNPASFIEKHLEVVKANQNAINFDGFKIILDRFKQVIEDYNKKNVERIN